MRRVSVNILLCTERCQLTSANHFDLHSPSAARKFEYGQRYNYPFRTGSDHERHLRILMLK